MLESEPRRLPEMLVRGLSNPAASTEEFDHLDDTSSVDEELESVDFFLVCSSSSATGVEGRSAVMLTLLVPFPYP